MSKNIVNEAAKLAGVVVGHESEVLDLTKQIKKAEETIAAAKESLKGLRAQVDPAKTRLAESQTSFTSFIETIEAAAMRPRVREAALAMARAQYDLERGVAADMPEGPAAPRRGRKPGTVNRKKAEAAAAAAASDAAIVPGGEPREGEQVPGAAPAAGEGAPIVVEKPHANEPPATIETAAASHAPVPSEAQPPALHGLPYREDEVPAEDGVPQDPALALAGGEPLPGGEGSAPGGGGSDPFKDMFGG